MTSKSYPNEGNLPQVLGELAFRYATGRLPLPAKTSSLIVQLQRLAIIASEHLYMILNTLFGMLHRLHDEVPYLFEDWIMISRNLKQYLFVLRQEGVNMSSESSGMLFILGEGQVTLTLVQAGLC